MSLGTVCAVVVSQGREDLEAETVAALATGTAAPQEVLSGTAGVAAATTATWLWLLDGLTVPEPGALAAFAAAHDQLVALPTPHVLASKVLDARGKLHPDAAPRHEIFEKELTVAAVERGLVQLRAAPSGSVLIRREDVERLGGLRADLPPSWAVFELTARALRSPARPGYLVPGSVAVRPVAARSAGRRSGAARTRARLLAGPAWNPTERLWEAFLVAEDAVKDARGPARPA